MHIFTTKVINPEKSKVEFEYGITKYGEKVEPFEVERIFLDKSWKFEIGKCPSFRTIVYSGKDIAILLLKNEIKLKQRKKFPKLRMFHTIENLENQQIVSFGYPSYLQDHKPQNIKKTTILRKTHVQKITNCRNIDNDNQYHCIDADGSCFPGFCMLSCFVFQCFVLFVF